MRNLLIIIVQLVIDKVKHMGDERLFHFLAVVYENLSRDKQST